MGSISANLYTMAPCSGLRSVLDQTAVKAQYICASLLFSHANSDVIQVLIARESAQKVSPLTTNILLLVDKALHAEGYLDSTPDIN